MECTGQHQGEEAAEARRQGDHRDRDGVAAEGRDGGRGGGGRGSAKTQKGGTQGTEQRGGEKEERRKAKQWGRESAEGYPSG